MPLIMVKAFSIDFYSQTNTSQPIDSLWFWPLHMRVNPSGEPQILTKTCVKKPLAIPLRRAHTPAVIYRAYRLINEITSSAFPQFHSRFLCSLTECQWLHFSSACSIHLRYDMTCDLFPLVNVTQTTAGGGARRGSKNSIAHCAPSEKLREMRRKCQFLFFFSPALGFISSQNTHLPEHRENTLNSTRVCATYTRRRSPLRPFPTS